MYTIWVLMPYLTDVWKLNLTHAALIINVFMGSAMIMPLGMSFLVDAFVGDYWMLLLSSLSYCFGLGFLAMSTPPVLSQTAGNCSAYQPDCIGDTQQGLFYTGLALIAVGLFGHVTSLASFLGTQIARLILQLQNEEGDDMHNRFLCMFCQVFTGSFAVIIVAVVGAIAIPFIKPWSLRFGIPAIFTVVATVLFVSGSSSYAHDQGMGSSLTTLLRVIVAAGSKLFHCTPRDANELYEIHGDDVHNVPHTCGLRCLDKAAIIVPSQTLEQQKQNRWKLCRVTEVEETKTTIHMIPVWMTFIMCGVIGSLGSTYFLEQANQKNPKVGKLKVPLPVLLLFYEYSKSLFAKIYESIGEIMSACEVGKHAHSVGFIIGMILSILCCITAAKIESRRLDSLDDKTPMSMFWLLPQFFLLGGVDSCAFVSFLFLEVPRSFRQYSLVISSAVYGLGIIGNSLVVYVVGQVSEKGGRPSWFQDTLNRSRLDNYYWTMAVMSAVNLVLIILVSLWYNYQELHNIDIPVPIEDPIQFQPNAEC